MVGGKEKYTELVMELITKRLIKKNIVLMTTKIDAGAWNAHKCEPTELDGARNSMSHRMIDFDLT